MTDYTDNYIGFGGGMKGYASSKDPHHPDFGLVEDVPKPARKPAYKSERNLFDLADKREVPKPQKKPKHHFNKDVVLEDRLLHIIGDAESGNNYNVIVGGEESPLTTMTLQKVRDI